jgi:hypothetical protein
MHDKHFSPFHIIVCLLWLSACENNASMRPAAETALQEAGAHSGETKAPGPLATAGAHSLSADQFVDAVSEARVLRHWKTNRAAQVESLRNPKFRRKLLIRALETRIVRHEVQQRRLLLDLPDSERLLDQAMLGLPPMSVATASQRAALPDDPDEVDARLFARYGMAARHARRAVQDLAEHGALAKDLVAAVPEAEIRTDWADERTCFRIETYRVPRVPTSQEIERAVKGRKADIVAYFNDNQRLFSRPARIFLRRFRLAVKDDATKAAIAQARSRVVAVRARVSQGEDLEAIVRTEGAPQDRRSGGRFTVKKAQKPGLFDQAKGHLTEVERTPFGWVFYQIEGQGVELKRELSDSRVQREIGAALLRRDDTLPSAARRSGELANKLRAKTPRSVLQAWLSAHRIRSAETKKFCQTVIDRIPTIGLARKLAPVVFSLSEAQPVSRRVTVRQDYVITRLIERTDPTEAMWTSQKDAYIQQWKAKKGPVIVREWLNTFLKTVPLGLAIDRLNAMTIEQLTGD